MRIIVDQPRDWNQGNLFGEIFSDRGGRKLKIRLSQPIRGRRFSSDILMLTPRTNNETFKPLQQFYAVNVTGSILNEENNKEEFVINGHVTYD